MRDAFELAKEKCKDQERGGAIIFIDEVTCVVVWNGGNSDGLTMVVDVMEM